MNLVRSGSIALVLVALMAAPALLAGCAGGSDGATNGTTATAEPTATPAAEPTATPAAEPTATPAAEPPPASTAAPTATPTEPPLVVSPNAYWAWSIETVSTGTPERLAAGGTVPAPTDLAGALAELMEGPNNIEVEIGMATEIPASTALLGTSIDGSGIAVIDLSTGFEEPSGTLSETFRIAQVVYTATQFPAVSGVRFSIDGVVRDSLGSHGFDVSQPLDRGDFTDIRPAIMVTSPRPGEAVADGFAITGESNTFEATLEWVVTNSEGLIVSEGFTTATAGNGEWGTYSVNVDLPENLVGRGAVIVFETSARDGSQVNLVEYPVRFG